MQHDLARGAVAGALGTVALNVATYLDVAVRGRPMSSMPAKTVGTVADAAGVPLAEEGSDSEVAEHRRQGLGGLLGYATGIGVGAAWGLVPPNAPRLPLPLAALAVGGAAMAGSDIPMTAAGLTDPRKWGAKGWAGDAIPHLAYGIVTAVAFDRLAPRRRPRFTRR